MAELPAREVEAAGVEVEAAGKPARKKRSSRKEKNVPQFDLQAELKRVCGLTSIDGIDVMTAHKNTPNTIFFIDPPYTASGKKAGSRLYRQCDLDHSALFELTASLNGDFLMTYDDAEGVRDLATHSKFDIELVAMKNTHHAKMTELLIGRDLSWSRQDSNSPRQFEFNFDS